MNPIINSRQALLIEKSEDNSELSAAFNSEDLIADELMLEIFSHLDPESLAACEGVCRRWNVIAKDDLLYLRLSEKVAFFFRVDGKQHFSANSKQRFLKNYLETFALKEEGKNHFQTILDLQNPCNEQTLVKKWDSLFMDDMDDISTLKEHYPLKKNKEALIATLHMGALKFELKNQSIRPLVVGCAFGDIELTESVLEKMDYSPTAKPVFQDSLTYGAFSAIIESQKDILTLFSKDYSFDPKRAVDIGYHYQKNSLQFAIDRGDSEMILFLEKLASESKKEKK